MNTSDEIELEDKSYPWVEEFRPSKIEQVIGAEHLIDKMNEYISQKSCPHLLFGGSAGVGKTTVAKILAKNISGANNYIYINASDRNNIDTIRIDVGTFCSTMAFENSLKIVILDECDGMTPQAQKSLRAVMEEFAKNCRFILTCNYDNKIIEALKSRCQQFEFRGASKNDIAKRCASILKTKGIELTEDVKKDLASLVKKFYPDIRATINNLQKFTKDGKFKFLTEAIKDETVDLLIAHLKAGKIRSIREEILAGTSPDWASLYNALYSQKHILTEDTDKQCTIVMCVAEFLYKHSFVLIPEINFTACLLEILNILKK